MSNNTLQFKNLLEFPHVVQGISTKVFGSMKKTDDKQIDRDALMTFASSIGIQDEIGCMQQIHSGNVSIITRKDVKRVSDTDGLVTNKKNTPLAVLTADCLPIMLYDPKKEIIAIAHAGYRGLLERIIENIISAFISEFTSDPKDIIVGIGPSIETKCYEVGKEVIEKFEKSFPTFKEMYIKEDGKVYLDLRSAAQQCLLKAGILEEHIEIMDICTKCDERFYSYRGGDGDKRFASVISLV